jgi:AcrR family transcriptional regulator
MAADDIATRVTLLERTTVLRDDLTAREDRLLERFEAIMDRYVDRLSDDQEHRFKVFGHEIADQLRNWSDKIHAERNLIDEKRDARIKAELPQPVAANPYRSFIARNWVWLGIIGIMIIALRPDLAGAVVRIFI